MARIPILAEGSDYMFGLMRYFYHYAHIKRNLDFSIIYNTQVLCSNLYFLHTKIKLASTTRKFCI